MTGLTVVLGNTWHLSSRFSSMFLFVVVGIVLFLGYIFKFCFVGRGSHKSKRLEARGQGDEWGQDI